jgi:hypothetical protein
MGFEVRHQFGRFACVELHVVHADELGPAKAEGAVRVAGLAGAGEEQDRLLVHVVGVNVAFIVHSAVLLYAPPEPLNGP